MKLTGTDRRKDGKENILGQADTLTKTHKQLSNPGPHLTAGSQLNVKLLSHIVTPHQI